MQIPIENIYFILCYAWNKLEEKDIVNVQSFESSNILNLFARVLISGISHLLKRGIDRNYIPFSEETVTVRGKINFRETINRNLLDTPNIFCDFSDLNYNVIHNQILKATIKILLNVKDIEEDYKLSLLQIYRRFYEIDVIHLNKKVFSLVKLNRNNYFYDFLLKVCEIIMDNLLIDDKSGDHKFRDFLQDEDKMNAVFEDFVRNFYRIEQSEYRVGREDILWDLQTPNLDAKKLIPKMQTDISLEAPNRKIIIEVKYYPETLVKNRFGDRKIRTGHLYQIFAYLKNIEKKGGLNQECECILLYPKIDESISFLNAPYEIPGHKIHIKTIDLNQNWKKIHTDLLEMIK